MPFTPNPFTHPARLVRAFYCPEEIAVKTAHQQNRTHKCKVNTLFEKGARQPKSVTVTDYDGALSRGLVDFTENTQNTQHRSWGDWRGLGE